MQRFQYPYLLHLLWLLIPLTLLFFFNKKWRQNRIERVFKAPILHTIIPSMSPIQEKVKWGLWIVMFLFLILGLANPQIGTKQEKIKGQGIDVMILLDVSNSMLAQDIQPNRLERSKLFISRLLDHLKHDRVGFIIFAGNAYLQVPLTIDYTSIKMSLPMIDPSFIPSQGTNIGEAVDLAGKSLGLTDSKSKGIVILSDGEDHDENANAAIQTARKNGIKVIAIGVGEEKGAPIPVGGDYKKDENGNTVMTAFNRKMLEELASIGNGSFYHLGQQSDIVEDVAADLSKIESKDFEDFDYSNYNSYFYWFVLIALILLLILQILPDIKISDFLRRISAVCFVLFICTNTSIGQTNENKSDKTKARTYIRKGNSSFQNNNFTDAELNYRKALNLDAKNKTAQYNLGNSLYNQQKYQEAAEQYQSSIEKNTDKLSKSKAYHNLGNSYFKMNQLDKAIHAYENALKLNPTDMDTKFNLALAKKQQKNKGGGGQNQQQQNKQEQNKGQGDKKEDQKQGEQPQEQPKEGDGQKDKSEPKENSEKGMNKDEAQRLLEALKNQEQNTQNKVEAKKAKPEQKKHEKDW